MGEKVEDEKLSSKCLPILARKFYKDRWVTSHVVPSPLLSCRRARRWHWNNLCSTSA